MTRRPRSPVYEHPRTGTSALVPGISLMREVGADEYPRWRVRASAQVDGRQRTRSWGLAQRRGLAEAITEAARYRAEHHPQRSAEDLVRTCWEAIPPETLERMREDGVDIARPRQ